MKWDFIALPALVLVLRNFSWLSVNVETFFVSVN